MITFKPRNDRVLIEPDPAAQQSPAGLYIPDNAQEKPTYATVLAVGPGAHDGNGVRVPMDIKAGDRVLFAKYSGTKLAQDGKELIILKESDILAVIIEDQPAV